MKKSLLILLLIVSFQMLGQKESRPPFPSNIVELGIGAGPNYGIFGVKTVIGYKGNGLIIGTGAFTGLFAYHIGVQGAYKWFYGSFCYGTVASVSSNFSSTELVNGMVIGAGGKVNLLRNKKMFLDLGAGYAFGAYYQTPFGEDFLGGPRIMLGLGFRLFDTRKKEKVSMDD